MKKQRIKSYIKNCIKDKEFRDEFHKWNFILKQEGREAIQPGKSSMVEQKAQQKYNKRGVPGWARGKR